MAHIAIVGAGITGVTTAYALLDYGHRVTLFERQRYAAMETSFANGGQLSASNAEVWNHPSTLAKALGWIFRSDAPLQLSRVGINILGSRNSLAKSRTTDAIRSQLSGSRSKQDVNYLRSRSAKELILIWNAAAFFMFIVTAEVLITPATSICSCKEVVWSGMRSLPGK